MMRCPDRIHWSTGLQGVQRHLMSRIRGVLRPFLLLMSETKRRLFLKILNGYIVRHDEGEIAFYRLRYANHDQVVKRIGQASWCGGSGSTESLTDIRLLNKCSQTRHLYITKMTLWVPLANEKAMTTDACDPSPSTPTSKVIPFFFCGACGWFERLSFLLLFRSDCPTCGTVPTRGDSHDGMAGSRGACEDRVESSLARPRGRVLWRLRRRRRRNRRCHFNS